MSQLQRLFEACSEFFELTEGAPPSPTMAAQELVLRAPNKDPEDTFCLGLFREDDLVGFIHLTRDFPKVNNWWLGLLLLHPKERGQGLGAEVHEALRSWVMANGAQVLWLGVLTQNEKADRFWRRQGYVERERQRYVSATGFESIIILMSLPAN